MTETLRDIEHQLAMHPDWVYRVGMLIHVRQSHGADTLHRVTKEDVEDGQPDRSTVRPDLTDDETIAAVRLWEDRVRKCRERPTGRAVGIAWLDEHPLCPACGEADCLCAWGYA